MNEKLKMTIAFVACAAGVVGYYILASKTMAVRASVLLVGLVIGGVIGILSDTGRQFFDFARESVRETKKVVWPERKDSLRATAIVFGFSIVMALFLFGTDKVLEIVLYNLILGWNR